MGGLEAETTGGFVGGGKASGGQRGTAPLLSLVLTTGRYVLRSPFDTTKTLRCEITGGFVGVGELSGGQRGTAS